jgi:biotin transport system substrate-specific component
VESRAITRIALLAAVIAVLGMLPSIVLPIAAGVPITAQTLGVMLAGIVLGPRDGALAVVLFVFVVALGAPLLAGGRGGLGVFVGPTVGFLIGFIPGACACGMVMRWMKAAPIFAAAIVAAIGGGILVVYICGISGLMIVTRMSLPHAIMATLVFLPGDFLKALATAFVIEAAYRIYPSAIASRA